ncbi:MAG TPA: hypothetical protein PKO15_17260 [Fibrobacteria bacterium]|nr:hypothetical protein [Fibrobacteria bacterium]
MPPLAARLPLHKKSLRSSLFFLTVFTLSTPLVSCGDGPKAKGKTFGHVNKKEAIPLSVIASETDIDSAEKKYLGKEFTFKDLLPVVPVSINDEYSSRNKCGFSFKTFDQKVILTTWINMPPRWDRGNRQWVRYLPHEEVYNTDPLEVDFDACSKQQHLACSNQTDKLAGRDILVPTKTICNFAPENVFISGKIAEIWKIQTEDGFRWKISVVTRGISN